MRFSNLVRVAIACASTCQALNILLTNDDGFGSGNLREVYRLLRKAGHNAWIVAPSDEQSGQGGRAEFTTEANLTSPAQFDLIPKGAPSIGRDPKDSHIWYYNGTPAATTFVALDYVLPKFADFKVPDLHLSGPNFGTNLGPFVWTLSGTAGSSYVTTERSIPSIAISASNKKLSYLDIKNETNEATWIAQVAVKIVDQVIKSAPKGAPLLPLGYGLSVNIPPLTKNNTSPKIVHARMSGNAQISEAVLDPKKGTFSYANLKPYAAGINVCINGDCSLPGETYVVAHGQVSISIYIVDYDSPTSAYTDHIVSRIKPLTK